MLAHREASAHDDRIDVAHGGPRPDAGRHDLLDGLGDELDVWSLQRWIEVVRDQDALAAEAIARRQLGSQRPIGNLSREDRPYLPIASGATPFLLSRNA